MKALSTLQRLLGIIAVLLVLGAATTYLLMSGRGERTITVNFPSTVGLYAGDSVNVLGVSVGHVTSVTPQRDSVRVALTYRSDIPLPADVKAAVLAPTLVTGRYVQLSPIWSSGPQLADGADIPIGRTAVPVEWGQIKQQLLTLSSDLGPNGTNSSGALNRILQTTADNLGGQGTNLHDSIDQLSRAVTTLSDSRGDLFGTLRNLETFVFMLKQNDQQVQDFNAHLASVSEVLAENSQNLSTALTTLDATLPLVEQFVADNRDKLSTDLNKLGQVTGVLAANRQSLADTLQIAASTVSNVHNIYDPVAGGSLTGVLPLSNLRDPASFICATIFSAGGTPEQCTQAIGPLAGLLKMDNIPVTANPLNRNGRSDQIMPDGSPVPAGPAPSPLLGLDDLLVPGGN